MLKEIQKLIAQYDQKIADCDKLIENQRKAIQLARKNNDTETLKAVRKEMAIKKAECQAYVQAKYDIDSLIDYI